MKQFTKNYNDRDANYYIEQIPLHILDKLNEEEIVDTPQPEGVRIPDSARQLTK